MTDYTNLVEALRNNDWSDACPCCDEAMCKDADCIILQASDAIEALQAQLPKRGKWVDGDARRVTARCSVCGHLRLGNGAEWANKHVHFCELCGSRMGDEKA